MSKIDSIMEGVMEHIKDGVLEVKEAKEAGRPIIGTYCTFAPWELITSTGGVTATLCARGEDPIAAAEEHLPRNLCPLIKSSYGYALTDKCPYFHFCDIVVAESTCDGKKKMYELLQNLSPVHVMQLPQSTEALGAYEQMKREIKSLKERLEDHFNVEITDEKLKNQIKLRNREREALKSMWELSSLTPPAITGREQYAISEYCEFHFDKESLIPWLEKTVADIKAAYDAGERRVPSDSPRILVTGCPLGGVKKVLDAVEEAGGVIVCYENCGGVKELGFLVDEEKDPIDAMTEKYLNIGCSVMSPNKNRMENLTRLIDKYRVDGVIEVVLQACHTYAVETYEVKNVVKSKEIPYMTIDTDYSKSDIGQLSTRVSAFLEMI